MRSRAIAAVALLALVYSVPARGYPGDVFMTAAPLQAPTTSRAETGTATSGHAVSADGAATYSIPIPTAPNRLGFVPELTLSYSSRGAVRGGIAVGWSLDIPRIEPSTTRGVLAQVDYVSTLSRGRLVRVGPPAAVTPGTQALEEYRAREDAAGTRYLRVVDTTGTIGWQAHTVDGRVFHFGETVESKDRPSSATAGVTLAGPRYFVTRIVDRFHNEIAFHYETVMGHLPDWNGSNVPVDVSLVRVEYGRNAPAGLEHHARIELDHAPAFDLCPGSQIPIGAAYDRRTGYPRIDGARRLTAIRLEVKSGATWTMRRKLELEYDAGELACDLTGSLHAPLRLLEKIRETAVAPDGMVTVLPPIELEYGRVERAFTRSVLHPGDLGSGQQALSNEKAGGWPTVNTMMLDLDGDARVDRLSAVPPGAGSQDRCEADWQRNTATGWLGKPRFSLPVMPWVGPTRRDTWTGEGMEGCSLSAQFNRASNHLACGYAANYLTYRYMDVGGDGLLDLVTGLDSQRGAYRVEHDARVWPQLQSCSEPLDCMCMDEGACTDDQGDQGLCTIIDSPSGPYIYQGTSSGTDCGPACQHEQAHAVPNAAAEPIQVIGLSEDESLFFYIGKRRQQMINDVQLDEQTQEDNPMSTRGAPGCQMYPETQCGHYILRVYDNLGNGQFATQPRVIYAPIPLETDRPTSRLGAGRLAASSSWHGFIDLDGDGIQDAVYKEPDWVETPQRSFQVFRGLGGGAFAPDPVVWHTDPLVAAPRVQVSGTRNYGWSFPPAVERAERGASTPAITASYTSVTMLDMNGDGLPDYVDGRESATAARRLRVLFNTGRGFEPRSVDYGGTRFDPAGAEGLFFDEEQQWQDRVLGSDAPSRGFSRATWRAVDIDSDGLVDLVGLPPLLPASTDDVRPFSTGADASWQRVVYFNVGDTFVRATNVTALDGIWRALARIRVTDVSSGGGYQGRWQVLTDFVDLDGDGLPEAINNDAVTTGCAIEPSTGRWNAPCAAAYNNGLTDPLDGRALRALSTIRNGKGGTIRFQYANTQTTTGRVPFAVWSVASLVEDPGVDADGQPAPVMTTTYAYDAAQYRADLDGRWAFRGFGTVTVTRPSGARAVRRSDFTQDYAGLVVDERVYDDGAHAATIESSAYEARTLFPGTTHEVRTFHRIETRTRTCKVADAEAACAAGGDLTRVAQTWESLPAGAPRVHVIAQKETSPGLGDVEGAVGNTKVQRLVDEPGKYWLLTDVELAWSRGPGGAGISEGQVYLDYDPGQRTLASVRARVEAGGGYAITTHDADLVTGVTRGIQTPRFHGTPEGWTRFEHDATKTFVVRATNALGHAIETRHDPATGVLVESRGPNQKLGMRDGWTRTIDGLGRPVAEHVYVDDPVQGYRLEQTARFAYHDTPAPRTRVVEERQLEAGGLWTRNETELDGLGRSVRTAEYEHGVLRAVARSYHDASGKVVRVRAPRPGQATGTYVDWQYTFDRLGRQLAAREPSRAGCTGAITGTGWCGDRWAYDGRTIEQETVTGTAGGAVARTRSTNDFLGRLAQVEERTTDGGWATTKYRRDGRGNVVETANADGVVTAATFDYLDRKRSVTRGDKTWTFGCDLDGNVETVMSPVPPFGDPMAYITSIAYDPLGRITSELGAPREWTATELATFGAPMIARAYDTGPNGIGRQSRVELDAETIEYAYDASGRPTHEVHQLRLLDGAYQDKRTIERSFGLQGQLVRVLAADGASAATASELRYRHDSRGLPFIVDWYRNGQSLQSLQMLTRAADGRVIERKVQSGHDVIEQARWTYDEAGRITELDVRSRLPNETALTTRASEQFVFDGAANVKQLTTVLTSKATGAPHQATYTYDAQHRLTSATGPQGYSSRFAYSPGGRITAARVATTSPYVPVRDVTYSYGTGDADPDAPVQLVDRATQQPWMTIDYDVSGNAAQRTRSGATHLHRYDGFDRQRAVERVGGGIDLYWYGSDHRRTIVVTKSAAGTVERVKWTVGEAEIWYRGDGTLEKEVAYSNLAGATTRVEDHQRRETFHTDPRGHVIAVIGEDGALTAGFRYGPYGELLEALGPESGDLLHRYNSKQHDPTSDLSYYGYRYYDATTLSWTQPDPKYLHAVERAGREPRRASLFAFSLGNPVSLVDPDGRDTTPTPSPAEAEAASDRELLRMAEACDGSTSSAGCIVIEDWAPPKRIYYLKAPLGFGEVLFPERNVIYAPFSIAKRHGFDIRRIENATAEDVRWALRDPSVYGVVVLAHGNPDGLQMANGTWLDPMTVTDVSPHLEFFVTIACQQNIELWNEVTGADAYGYNYKVPVVVTPFDNPVNDAFRDHGVFAPVPLRATTAAPQPSNSKYMTGARGWINY